MLTRDALQVIVKTIYAVSTPSGKGGIAVVRVSGPDAFDCVLALTKKKLPTPKKVVLRNIYRPTSGDPIDQGMVVRFTKGRSATGEKMAEFRVHSGPAVVSALLDALGSLDNMVMAEAGEFSLRAFENGRMDLTEIEGLADLVAAETDAQRLLALRQMRGDLAKLYGEWRERLAGALALLEADVDFADEDLPDNVSGEVEPNVSALVDEMSAHLREPPRGERIRDGVRIAILGATNVGKSKLLNTLASRDVAIVSDVEGTTRDLIEVNLDLGGYPVTVIDTAGLRDTGDEIELEGIRRAREAAERADLKIVMMDVDHWPDILSVKDLLDRNSLLVVNKIDQLPKARDWPADGLGGKTPYFLSALKGDGLDELLDELTKQVIRRFGLQESPSLTRARHREALHAALKDLRRYLRNPKKDPELAAEDLRQAVRHVGRITGVVETEELLGRIFADFCIGK